MPLALGVCEASLGLQRVFELQEEAAIADDALAFLQSIEDLRLAALAIADLDEAATELVCSSLHINERLVFRVAKHGGVGYCERIANRTGLYGGGDVHVLFQFFAGIAGDDACLQSARVGVECG